MLRNFPPVSCDPMTSLAKSNSDSSDLPQDQRVFFRTTVKSRCHPSSYYCTVAILLLQVRIREQMPSSYKTLRSCIHLDCKKIGADEITLEILVVYKFIAHFFCNLRLFSFFIRFLCHFQRIWRFFFHRLELLFIYIPSKAS